LSSVIGEGIGPIIIGLTFTSSSTLGSLGFVLLVTLLPLT
jgi:hypothetical protein